MISKCCIMEGSTFKVLLVALAYCVWVDPVFSQTPGKPIVYHTDEELPAGSMVGNITKSAGITNFTELQEMEFNLAEQRDKKWDLFKVDAAGILRTMETIDRDKICAQEDECAVNLRIIVQPIKYFRVIKVTVHIDDRNDNPPTFPRQTLQLSLTETTPPETSFSLPVAEDLDSAQNGVEGYQINPTNGPFSLDVQDTAGGDVNLRLVLQRKLDREKEDSYTMWVTAVDRGQPQLTGSMLVQVKVLDANDNNPKFENSSYKVMVPENTPVGTTILLVKAWDADIGPNGEIYYGFSDATAEAYGKVFQINSETGELSVIGEIDYESFDLYQLTIIARDRGDNSLPAYAKVDVHVEDLNDHAPVITLNTLTPGNNAQVSEGAAVGLFVAHVSVSDPDGGEIKCSMDSDLFGLQDLTDTEYKIVTKAVFDREKQSEYHMNLVCQDRGQPPLTSTKYIPVTVTDENDHDPVFTQMVYNHTMEENNEIGLALLQLSTTDEDLGRNAAVVFEIHGANEQVHVDRITGVVIANTAFDYEKTNFYEYLVVAVDQGDPPRTATATLIINILDVNDNNPVFSEPHYIFKIQENTKVDLANVEIGQVTASDVDSEPYNEIIYSFEEPPDNHSLDFSRMFSMDPNTGMIFLNHMLDREVREFYSFHVKAENEGYPQMFSVASVEVHVVDRNDNRPSVYLHTYNCTMEGNNTIRLSENLPKGKVIAKIGASDADTGANAVVSYKLVNISNNLFRLDTGTGEILLNVNLQDSPFSITRIVIEVSDKGTPKLSTIAEVKIIVNQSGVALAPPVGKSTESFWNTKSYFAIGIAGTCLLIIILAVISVMVVKSRRKVKDKKHTYNCRLEAEKSTTQTPGGDGPPGSGGDQGKNNRSFEGDLKEPEKVMVKGVELGESCTDESWPKAQENHYILDPTPKLEHDSKRDSGIELKVDLPVNKLPDPDAGNQRHLVPPQHHPPTPFTRLPGQHTPLKEMDLQMQDMLHMLLRDKESPSETGSVTDSGKGPSEEGDHSHSWPDYQMDGAKGLPTVMEAHALALTDNLMHTDVPRSYASTPDGSANPYGGYSDEGIYVEAIPREMVYAQDPNRRAHDYRKYKGHVGNRLLPIPSYTPPPSYHESLYANKRIGRFASYNHHPPPSAEREKLANSGAIPRTLSDSAADQSHDQEELYASVFKKRAPQAFKDGSQGHMVNRAGKPQLFEENPYESYKLQSVPNRDNYSEVYDRLRNMDLPNDGSDADLYTPLTHIERPNSRSNNDRTEMNRALSPKNKLQRTRAERVPETVSKDKKPKVQFWDEGPIDKCVHDVVARYIPDRSDNNCVNSIDGFSDDDVTTESGSYVIDSNDMLKEKNTKEAERMFVDYIVV